MSEITMDGGTQLWQLTSESGRGMVTGTASGPLRTALSYDLGGRVTSRTVRRGRPTVFSSSYQYDPYTGNMTRRTCGGLTEQFTFDGLNRLTGNGTDEYDFDDLGNVTVRDGAGELAYDSTAPYAATFLTPETGSLVPLREQHIHYNALQRPDTIAEGGVTVTLAYRADGSRAEMYIDSVGVAHWKRAYRGQLEEHHQLYGFSQPIKSLLWLGGTAYDAPAALLREDGNCPWVLHRVVRDHLGSIVAVTDSAGFVEQRLSYDAWGALRNPDTGAAYAPGTAPRLMLMGRGYTGHEHLPWFGLVNMNARLYDPAVARFLSPDPMVQQPEGTQGFNRYSYCLNNPLRYVDLDGENTYIFNKNGKLERVEYNIYTNRIMVHTKESSNGLVWDSYQYYDLADPINDGFDIENGIITHLEFVPESDVFGMLYAQGAWDAGRSEFILQSLGGGRFDYSYSVLQYKYKDADFDGARSKYLFLPDGDYMAHNFMNFGNYLWAATGYVVGFDISSLQLGAHLNSKMNGRRDGTSSEWDSEDDQRSIITGYYHAYRNGYRNH